MSGILYLGIKRARIIPEQDQNYRLKIEQICSKKLTPQNNSTPNKHPTSSHRYIMYQTKTPIMLPDKL